MVAKGGPSDAHLSKTSIKSVAHIANLEHMQPLEVAGPLCEKPRVFRSASASKKQIWAYMRVTLQLLHAPGMWLVGKQNLNVPQRATLSYVMIA